MKARSNTRRETRIVQILFVVVLLTFFAADQASGLIKGQPAADAAMVRSNAGTLAFQH